MASTSSKALPYISLIGAFALAVLSAMGHGDQISKVLGALAVVLPITAGGGLVNKYIDTMKGKADDIVSDPAFVSTVTKIVDEFHKAKEAQAAAAPTTTSSESPSPITPQ